MKTIQKKYESSKELEKLSIKLDDSQERQVFLTSMNIKVIYSDKGTYTDITADTEQNISLHPTRKQRKIELAQVQAVLNHHINDEEREGRQREPMGCCLKRLLNNRK